MSLLIRAADLHRVKKDWGWEEWIVNNDRYCSKRMLLNRGWQCSLHHHKIKHETFFIQSGKVYFELGIGMYILYPGDAIEIPVGINHRFGGIEDSVIFETSTHHDDSDSYRVSGEESRYNGMLIKGPI